MKPRQRQAAILEFLQSQGKCSVEELAQHFDTTGTTIRKDLVILENAGTVIRTYGGVVLNKDEPDPPIDHKTLINTHKKALIAETAVHYIHDGDSIILDAGSTGFSPRVSWRLQKPSSSSRKRPPFRCNHQGRSYRADRGG